MFLRPLHRLLLLLVLFCMQGCILIRPVLQKMAYNERRHYYEEGTTNISKDTINYTYDGHIIVGVKLNNDTTTHKYIVDNGLNSILSNDDAKNLNLRPLTTMTGYDAHKNIQAFSVYKLDSFKIGAQTFYNYGFSGGDDLKAVPNKGINGVNGFVGLNILEQGVWSFNNLTGQLIIANNINEIPAERKAYRIPLKKHYGRWFVALRVNGIKTKAILDFGYNGSLMLPKKMMDKIKPKSMLTYYGLTNYTLAGVNYDTLHYSRGAKIELAQSGLDLESKMICFSNSPLPLLGVGFVTQYCFTIDLSHNTLYLAPLQQDPHANKHLKTWGLNINKQNGDWIVTTLLKDSEAENKGIHIGDKLVSINDKTPVPGDDQLSLKLINEALQGDGPLSLDLLRDGASIKLVLREKVEY